MNSLVVFAVKQVAAPPPTSDGCSRVVGVMRSTHGSFGVAACYRLNALLYSF